MAANFTAQERQYYDQLFNIVDKDDSGVLPGQDALPFLTSSKLNQQTLGEIWAIADPSNNGFLTKEGWYKTARIIGWLQKGGQKTVQDSLATKPGPMPTFEGHPGPPAVTGGTAPSGPGLPPLTPADRTKFTRIFVSCGPQNGLVSGDKAREVFLKSQLNYDKLGQIWNLADTQQRGNLDLTDFIVAMYLIQSCMANPSLNLPPTLPNGIYEAASGGRPPTRSGSMSPMVNQHTGGSIGSPVRAQHTGNTALQQQLTGQSMNNVPPPRSTTLASLPSSSSFANTGANWDVTAEEKANSDRFFTQLDTQNRGVIDGDVAVPFMLQSQLDEGSLASIWDLVDIRHEGKLGRDEFAVAMHIINAKLAGRDIPSTLPNSLVPPSLRSAFNAQETLSGPSNVTKDLFDLFDDDSSTPAPPQASSPPQQPTTASFLPQPPSRRSTGQPPQTARQVSAPQSPPNVFAAAPQVSFSAPNDLLGDDTVAAATLSDNSAEVGNKRNQLATTSEHLSQLEKTRGELEQTAQSGQDEISQLETNLSNARVKHEAETKAVADLRARVSAQKDKLQELQGSVIAAESDLSGMRSEKDELEQALLRDKEEVRQLQKRMKEVNDEKVSLKNLLEKLRKDARQQKGMVSIAKKQLTTGETSRDAAQKDLDQHAAQTSEAVAVPLPATPRALSPNATGVSQRSNNPFDRLGAGRSDSRESSSAALSPAAPVPVAPVVAQSDAAHLTEGAEVVPTATEPPMSAASGAATVDSLGPAAPSQTPKTESDPFGAKSDDPFDSSFPETAPSPGEIPSETPAHGAVAASRSAPTDFDSAFADFDDEFAASKEKESDVLEKASPLVDSPETTTAQLSHTEPVVKAPTLESSGQAHSEPAEPLEPSTDQSKEVSGLAEEPVSSDDEEGPEDLETVRPYKAREDGAASPNPTSTATMPVSSSPLDKTRRSAPAPPSRSSTKEEPKASLGSVTPAAPVALVESTPRNGVADRSKFASFDDDDFDFTDQPPAAIESNVTQQPAKAFDDEFAAFDDEFESKASSQPNTGSDNSKTFEIIHPPSAGQAQPAKAAPVEDRDEWGLLSTGGSGQAAPAAPALSFDDAFGGAFEPSPTSYQPPPGSPPSALNPPPPPERRPTGAQMDDIEDVKKLCGMGFSRSLVVEALAANGYDFQRALNVLLVQ